MKRDVRLTCIESPILEGKVAAALWICCIGKTDHCAPYNSPHFVVVQAIQPHVVVLSQDSICNAPSLRPSRKWDPSSTP